MRILLDECVNPRLRLAFPGDEVSTVAEMGWRSLTNGQLMKEAAEQFDVFVTLDQNLQFQSPTGSYPLGKAIFIFAGGSCHNFREFNKERVGQEEAEFRDVKGPDFVSRLQGFIDIKGPNPVKPEADKQSSSDGDSAHPPDAPPQRYRPASSPAVSWKSG